MGEKEIICGACELKKRFAEFSKDVNHVQKKYGYSRRQSSDLVTEYNDFKRQNKTDATLDNFIEAIKNLPE